MARTLKAVELQVERYVRYFESGGDPTFSRVTPINGMTEQELAERARNIIAIAFQTFSVVSGVVPLPRTIVPNPDRATEVNVRSGEFDFSPKYYINGQLVPASEVRYNDRSFANPSTRFWVKTRYETYEPELEEPKFIHLTEAVAQN